MARKRKRKRLIFKILVAFIIVIIVGSIGFMSYMEKGSKPFDPNDETIIAITIPSGTSTQRIGDILESHGVIANSRFFKLKAKLDKLDGRFKAGDYYLSPSMDMDEIMQIIQTGTENTLRFTIPEGYDIKRTADVLQSNGLINTEEFLKVVKDGDFDYWFLTDTPKGPNRLEGYLYPETYEVFATATERDIIDKMLSQFNKLFTEDHYERANELGMSINEVITLASIIEREAVVPEDRPIISGVFHNRLKIGMKLQSCATVQYILGEQKTILTTEDTQIDSPYNTYIIEGLPPHPICSPRIESINAALWPTETDYLYFLAKGDGSHVFSKTYEEHLRNKAKYID
ncbi:MAG: endolytic transglycosylase MltG [Clostridiales bacterium]|nr:endolytic transglycosylase MltG [Clostridiales bacterium]